MENFKPESVKSGTVEQAKAEFDKLFSAHSQAKLEEREKLAEGYKAVQLILDSLRGSANVSMSIRFRDDSEATLEINDGNIQLADKGDSNADSNIQGE